MKDFESWYTELKSNSLWWSRMNEMFCRKDLNKIAQQVHLYLLASENRLNANDFQDFRRLFQSFAQKSEDAPVRPQLQQVEDVKEDKEWKPADPAHVDKCVKEFFDMLNNSPMVTYKPPKREMFYNGKRAEKLPPHPVTTLHEAYIRERHLEYVKKNYDPKNAQPLPTWIPEHEFNLLYDNEML